MKKYFYIYKTTNMINNKFYIGVHSSFKLHDTSYLGSGVQLKRAIKKYGRENFKNEIIEYFSTFEEALEAEKIIVNVDLVKLPECYNLTLGGRGSNGETPITPEQLKRMSSPLSAEVKEKISKTLMGKSYLTEEGREKIIETLKGNKHAAGMTYNHTQEAKDAISQSRIGKKMSEESLIKLKKNRKGKCTGSLNAMSCEIHRNKIRDSKIGLRALYHDQFGMKLAKPDSDKWILLISQGYKPKN
jgi:group I intron endonuclease